MNDIMILTWGTSLALNPPGTSVDEHRQLGNEQAVTLQRVASWPLTSTAEKTTNRAVT
jgi:hypothetical protein